VGIYASGEYKIGKLSLRAGARYSHDRKRDTVWGYSSGLTPVYQTDAMTTAFNGNSYYTLAPQTASVSGGYTTWDASATYALTNKINFYTRLSRAGNPGSRDVRLDPEHRRQTDHALGRGRVQGKFA
jgi:iron complex outermembrane receptor protein